MTCFTAARVLKHTRIHSRAQTEDIRCLCATKRHSRTTLGERTVVAAADSSSSTTLTTDWEARRKQRVVRDLVEASKRLGPQYTADAIRGGVDTLESLLPGLQIDVEAMKARDWAKLCLDVNAAATRIVVIKMHYPNADLSKVIQRQPQLLLQDVATLEDNARQVKQLLESAKDPDTLLTALPSLMDPKTLISVLVTVKKWYFNKRDPVEVLEADPELILRAQACGVPFDPVYQDPKTGAWSAPGFNYLEKRADWQKYLDEKLKKRDYLPDKPLVHDAAEKQEGTAEATAVAADSAAKVPQQRPDKEPKPISLMSGAVATAAAQESCD